MKFIACVFALCALAVANASHCEVPCTREYFPVCGTDGEHFKMFSNPCVMRNEHCKDGHNWLQTRMSECPAVLEEDQPCEVPCTREFRPVCGSDGQQMKLFPNACVLRNQHCRDGHQWFETRLLDCHNFNLEEDQPCEVPCTRDFRPVCGTDGEHFKSFSNLCMLKNEHCKDGHSWFQTRMDSCSNDDDMVAHKNCATICPALYAPVCGFDGNAYKQFANKCMLNANNCRFNNHWKIVGLGECS